MPIAIAAGAVLVLAIVAGIGIAMSGSKSDGPDTGPVVTDSLDVIIDVRDFNYHPRDVSVPSGATVTWINYDSQPHTATEIDSEAWDTEVLSQDEFKAITFATPGEYGYYCTLHPYMRGHLTVREPGSPTPATSATP